MKALTKWVLPRFSKGEPYFLVILQVKDVGDWVPQVVVDLLGNGVDGGVVFGVGQHRTATALVQ